MTRFNMTQALKLNMKKAEMSFDLQVLAAKPPVGYYSSMQLIEIRTHTQKN